MTGCRMAGDNKTLTYILDLAAELVAFMQLAELIKTCKLLCIKLQADRSACIRCRPMNTQTFLTVIPFCLVETGRRPTSRHLNILY